MVNQRYSFDLGIVGGGPAGLATAFLAQERGLKTVLFERRTPPIDKACGEGLMPSGRQFLQEHGVELDHSQSFSFRGVRHLDGNRSLQACFPGGSGLGYRRVALHQALVDRAREAGVSLCWNCRVLGLEDHLLHTDQGNWSCRWIVGADGLHSRVRDWLGIKTSSASSKRFGFRHHYRIQPWSSFVEVYWGESGEAYVTPVGPEEVCVALMQAKERTSFESILKRDFHSLESILAGAEFSSRHRGSGPLYRECNRVATEHTALVGDAAGFRDSITGKGISLSFQQAEYLVQALLAQDLSQYEQSYAALMMTPNLMVEWMLWLRKHPTIRRFLMDCLDSVPAIYSYLLTLNDGLCLPGPFARVLAGGLGSP